MGRILSAVVGLGIGFWAGPGQALDCGKPATEFVAAVCADVEMKGTYGAVENALSAALAAAPDQTARTAILEAQAEWEAAIWSWDIVGTRDLLGEDRLRGEIVRFAANRASALGGINAVIADERRFRAKNPGGGYSRTDTGCFFLGAAEGVFHYSDLFCGGYIRIQTGSRLCSFDMSWASGRIYAFMKVDEVQRIGLVHRGYCVVGNGIGPVCPGRNDIPDEPDHWDTTVPPNMTFGWDYPGEGPSSMTGLSPSFWRDANAFYDMAAQLDECLSAPVYPPPDLTWRGSGAQP